MKKYKLIHKTHGSQPPAEHFTLEQAVFDEVIFNNTPLKAFDKSLFTIEEIKEEEENKEPRKIISVFRSLFKRM